MSSSSSDLVKIGFRHRKTDKSDGVGSPFRGNGFGPCREDNYMALSKLDIFTAISFLNIPKNIFSPPTTKLTFNFSPVRVCTLDDDGC
jgi:hypothetical protein